MPYRNKRSSSTRRQQHRYFKTSCRKGWSTTPTTLRAGHTRPLWFMYRVEKSSVYPIYYSRASRRLLWFIYHVDQSSSVTIYQSRPRYFVHSCLNYLKSWCVMDYVVSSWAITKGLDTQKVRLLAHTAATWFARGCVKLNEKACSINVLRSSL